MKIMIFAHGHPDISPGGAETAAYNLHIGYLQNDIDSIFVARKEKSNNFNFIMSGKRRSSTALHREKRKKIII